MRSIRKVAMALGLAGTLAASAFGWLPMANVQTADAANASRTTYTDVAQGEWYYDAVDTVTNDLNLMSGYGGGLFGPKEALTREQFVQVLYKMSGASSNGYTTAGSKFTDVDTTAWYAPALSWAEANNVTSGTSATTFGTGQSVTREQMAKFMQNYCNQNGRNPVGIKVVDSFADAYTASDWAKDAVEWSRKAGLFIGDENRNFNPASDLTRAEAAQVLVNFYDNSYETNPVQTYILNTSSKKFHYSTCSSASKISESNKGEYTGTRDELIAQGYDPCGNCKP